MKYAIDLRIKAAIVKADLTGSRLKQAQQLAS
jgi:hypothetical protein